MERLQKIIANSGYCSRRKAEELIEQGRVKLNDQIAKLGDKANTDDKITINDESITSSGKKRYFILNKPKGILVTKSDPQNRKTIYDLPSLKNLENLNYAGRLDGMSEGLLILTNDGELIQKLTHPSHDMTKTYEVATQPEIKEKDIEQLKEGLLIDDRKFYAEISDKKEGTFKISIKEGRNRIIRRAMEKLGYKVFKLKRTSMAKIELGNLKPGEVKEISEKEIKQLI